MATIREYVDILSPPWLKNTVGGAIMHACATVLDGLVAKLGEGVKGHLPGYGTPTALGLVGDDRDIERGQHETDDAYIAQLQGAFDTWRHAGSPYAILPQLRFYFANNAVPDMRCVATSKSASTLWHYLDTSNGDVTKYTETSQNWIWNLDTQWWWANVIIDGTVYWVLDYWNMGGTWGDGGVWGSNMSLQDAMSLKRIVKKWKPANARVVIIISFDTTMYQRTNTLSGNVNGTGESSAWRFTQLANFSEQVL